MKWLPLIFLWVQGFSQPTCEWRLDYEGPPGNVQTHHFDSHEGDRYQIDFIAYVVIDTLRINSSGDVVTFAAGMDLPINHWGYKEYNWGLFQKDTSIRNDTLPIDFEFPYWNPYGCIRITYEVPKCGFDLSVIGNANDYTVYHVCVKRLSPGNILVDTIYSWNCDQQNSIQYQYDQNGCRKAVIFYQGNGIEEPIIHNPTCNDSLNGWLEFKTIPNEYGLGAGYHKITVSNEFCKRQFQFEMVPTKLCDDFYVPNVFSPNGDGINDIFTLFYPIMEQEFDLEIWDRWGDMAYKDVGLTGISGWDGGKYQPGVYVYRIVFLNHIIIGQITLVQ